MNSDNKNNNAQIKDFLWNQMPVIALIVLCVIASIVSNRFLSPINLNNVLMQGAVITVIAIGMTYVIVCGGFDLSVGSTAALSGCISTMVMLEYGIFPGVAAGVAIGAAVGLLNGLIVTKLDVNPFIATLGTMVMFRGATFLITGGRPVVGDEGLPETFLNFATERVFGIPYLVLFPILVFFVFHWLILLADRE